MDNKHIVLTVLSNKPLPGLVENHARYAHKWGYRHAIVDTTHVYGERQVVLFKWHTIYHNLVNSTDGTLLLVLDQFAVIYGAQELARVSDGYDTLVATQDLESDLPASSMMVFRNTSTTRETVRQLVLRVAQWAGHIDGFEDRPEPLILKDFVTPHPFTAFLSNGHIPSAQASWKDGSSIEFFFDTKMRPFVVHNAPQWAASNGRWSTTYDFDFRYVSLLIEEAALLEADTSLVVKYHQSEANDQPAKELHLNPHAKIAFVSLYTPNVGHYGAIHEENISRYCQLHGYGYHLYRENPTFLPPGVSANWAKMHLIQQHLRDHDFLFWIDADILAINQQLSIEKTIEHRDFIVGTDHAAWAINSCMFGVRNVPEMHEVVDRLCARILASTDKSTVYSSGGDQLAIQEGLQSLNMLNGDHVVDAMTLGTSPVYATQESRFVHFPAQLNHNRAATMEVWNKWSIQNETVDEQ